jgi:hypothetical protein
MLPLFDLYSLAEAFNNEPICLHFAPFSAAHGLCGEVAAAENGGG